MSEADSVNNDIAEPAPTVAEQEGSLVPEGEKSLLLPHPPEYTSPSPSTVQEGWFGIEREGGYTRVDHDGKLLRWKGTGNVRSCHGYVQHIYYYVAVQCSANETVYIGPGDKLFFSTRRPDEDTIYLATITRPGVACRFLCTNSSQTVFEEVAFGDVVSKSRTSGIAEEAKVAQLVETWLESHSATFSDSVLGMDCSCFFFLFFFLYFPLTLSYTSSGDTKSTVGIVGDEDVPKSLVSDDPQFEQAWQPSARKRERHAPSRNIMTPGATGHPAKHPKKHQRRKTKAHEASQAPIKVETAEETPSALTNTPVTPSTVAHSEPEAASILGSSIVVQAGATLHIGTLIQNHYHGANEENKKI